MTKEEARAKIGELVELAKTCPQVDVPVRHYFSDGVYAREICMPAEFVAVGKIHRKKNLNILSKGKVQVFSIEGFTTLEAPATWVSSPGVQRAVRCLEETVWTTIHGTHETDLTKIEETFIAPSYEALAAAEEQALLKGE